MVSCCHDTTWRWGVAILLPRRMVHRVKLDPHQERADAPRQPAARARWSPQKRDVALTGNIERRPSAENRWRVLLCSSTEKTSVLASRLSGEIYSFPLLQHFLPWHYFRRRASGKGCRLGGRWSVQKYHDHPAIARRRNVRSGLVHLTNPAFELQLVRRDTPSKALKRRNTHHE
jgi:hypothetical protein